MNFSCDSGWHCMSLNFSSYKLTRSSLSESYKTKLDLLWRRQTSDIKMYNTDPLRTYLKATRGTISIEDSALFLYEANQTAKKIYFGLFTRVSYKVSSGRWYSIRLFLKILNFPELIREKYGIAPLHFIWKQGLGKDKVKNNKVYCLEF